MYPILILNARFLVAFVFSLGASAPSSDLCWRNSFVLDCSPFPGLGTTSLPLLLFPPLLIKAAMLCEELLLLLGRLSPLGVHSMNFFL